jgi:hypothetical protein
MAGKESPNLEAAYAAIERLRQQAHTLRDRLKEAYDKIAVIEHAEAEWEEERSAGDDRRH